MRSFFTGRAVHNEKECAMDKPTYSELLEALKDMEQVAQSWTGGVRCHPQILENARALIGRADATYPRQRGWKPIYTETAVDKS